MKKQFFIGLLLGVFLALPLFVLGAESLAERLSGRLLLQVEDGGRVWYVSPVDQTRYEVTFGNALPLFRKLALGISNKDLANIPEATTLQSELLDSRYCVKEIVYIKEDGTTQTVKQEPAPTIVTPPQSVNSPTEEPSPSGTPTEPVAPVALAPTLAFTSDKTSAPLGDNVILQWNSPEADGCVLKINSEEENVEKSGVKNITISKRDNWAHVNCSNSKGIIYKNIDITGNSIITVQGEALPTNYLMDGTQMISKGKLYIAAGYPSHNITKFYYKIITSPVSPTISNLRLYKQAPPGEDTLLASSDKVCSSEECLYEFTVNETLYNNNIDNPDNSRTYYLKAFVATGVLPYGGSITTQLYKIDYPTQVYEDEVNYSSTVHSLIKH